MLKTAPPACPRSTPWIPSFSPCSSHSVTAASKVRCAGAGRDRRRGVGGGHSPRRPPELAEPSSSPKSLSEYGDLLAGVYVNCFCSGASTASLASAAVFGSGLLDQLSVVDLQRCAELGALSPPRVGTHCPVLRSSCRVFDAASGLQAGLRNLVGCASATGLALRERKEALRAHIAAAIDSAGR